MSSVETMKTWSKEIKSIEETPDEFKDFYKSLVSDTEELPYIILTPEGRWGKNKTNAKLICAFGNRVYFAEFKDKAVVSVCFPLENISYVESGTILLHSWLKIAGTVDGKPVHSVVEYNTVTEYLFKPIIEIIRQVSESSRLPEPAKGLNKFYQIKELSLKFLNYSRQCILPGEEVVRAVFQPDIPEKWFNFLGKTFFKVISVAHIFILTGKELIIIRDYESVKDTNRRHGGIWSFIPINRITGISLDENPERGTFTALIRLTDCSTIESMFHASERDGLDVMISELYSLKNAAEASGTICI